MDKKYLGKAINLPKAVHADLEKFRTELQAELGFEPSLPDAIAYLLKHRKPANSENPPSADKTVTAKPEVLHV